MKYQNIENFPNIDSWKIIDNNCFFVSDDVVKVTGKEVNIPISFPYWGIDFNPSFFNVFTNRSVNTFLNYQGKVINTFEERNFYYYFSDSSFIYYDRVSKRLMYNDLELLRGKMLSSYIFDELLFFEKENKIQTINFLSGQFLWEFPLASLGKGKDYSTDEEFDYEVEQFVGIYNNILWVYIERGGFIGLDIQTGELKHRILGIPKGNLLGKVDSYVDSEEFYIFYRAKFILDDKKGIIIGLIADRFFEIDLNKEKVTPMLYGMWDKMEKMNLKKYGVNGNTSLQGDLLYFYNDKELQFGVLDINTKEIIYVSEPIAVVERDDSFTRLRDLKVSENKVYILDSNHTLHIFEREE
ncbi:hypothetical protein RCZ04_06480 [Capnocytophaga sp. HP1101]